MIITTYVKPPYDNIEPILSVYPLDLMIIVHRLQATHTRLPSVVIDSQPPGLASIT